MSPQEKAKELFNSIHFLYYESGNDCTIGDCAIIPIVKFICEELMQLAHQSNDISKYNYYQDVQNCL